MFLTSSLAINFTQAADQMMGKGGMMKEGMMDKDTMMKQGDMMMKQGQKMMDEAQKMK